MQLKKGKTFLIIFLGLPTIILASQCQGFHSQTDCAAITCPRCYKPVCAYDGHCFQEFGNICEMCKENCLGGPKKNFRVISNSRCTSCHTPICPTCSDFCTEEFNPLCAYNDECYKTFSNKCFLTMENCKVGKEFHLITNGRCEDFLEYQPICFCPDGCITLFDPVCGSNGNCFKTFSNGCYMAMENCKNGGNFTYVYDGSCLTSERICQE